jgi:hypothetical protein
MDSHQSDVNFSDLPEATWLEIIKVCESDSLYSIYLVNKLFQQIIKNKELLPFRICLVMDPTTCKYGRQNLENSTIDFLSHHKFLQKNKRYELKFLTYAEFDKRFNNPQLNPMINMLEIDTDIFRPISDYGSILERVFYIPKLRILSLANIKTIPWNFTQIFSKNSFWQHLNICNGILSSFMDFSTCSFVKLSLDNINCRNGISIKMPHCLEECDLSCYQTKVGILSNCFTEFQMSHCKKLNTL